MCITGSGLYQSRRWKYSPPLFIKQSMSELDTMCLRALWSKQTVRLGRLHHRLGQPLRFSDIMAVAPEGPRETLTRASQAC